MNISFHLAMVSKWMILNDIHNIDIKITGDYLHINIDDHIAAVNHQEIGAMNFIEELMYKYDIIILTLND